MAFHCVCCSSFVSGFELVLSNIYMLFLHYIILFIDILN